MADEPKPKETGKSGTETSTGKNGGLDLKGMLAPIVAIVVLLVFVYFVVYMMGQRAADETQWTRAVYLFTAVESIAFAAAGFFFGSEVRRQEAQSARDDADKAKEGTDKAKEEASAAEKRATEAETKGKALAAAVEAKVAGQAERAGEYGLLGPEEAVSVTRKDFEEISALAKQLFG
jgi:hypothetical protein